MKTLIVCYDLNGDVTYNRVATINDEQVKAIVGHSCVIGVAVEETGEVLRCDDELAMRGMHIGLPFVEVEWLLKLKWLDV